MNQASEIDGSNGESVPTISNPATIAIAIGAVAFAQRLPDHKSSEVTATHLVCVLLVTVASWFLLRGHYQLQRDTVLWSAVRWHALLSLTVVGFIIGMRLFFPIASFAEAFPNTLQRVAGRLVVIPVIGLLAIAVLLLGCLRLSRSSIIVSYCACLTLTVALGPLHRLIR